MTQVSSAQERVSGYVVGSSNGGKSWSVRVKDEGNQIGKRKLKVSTVRVGTNLRPGLDVSFIVVDSMAADVAEAPRVEVVATKKAVAKDETRLGAMIVGTTDGFYAAFTGFTSRQEAQKWLDDMGAEEETAVDVVVMTPNKEYDDKPAIMALSALIVIGEENNDSICQTLERYLSEVFSAGVAYGKQQAGIVR